MCTFCHLPASAGDSKRHAAPPATPPLGPFSLPLPNESCSFRLRRINIPRNSRAGQCVVAQTQRLKWRLLNSSYFAPSPPPLTTPYLPQRVVLNPLGTTAKITSVNQPRIRIDINAKRLWNRFVLRQAEVMCADCVGSLRGENVGERIAMLMRQKIS